MANDKFYVTTPIYYVNSKPHLGTLYSTLLADVAARWNKLKGKKVFFLTGTDEHGQKIAVKAKQEGKTPREFVDSMILPFKKVWKDFELDFDKFIRTTDSEHENAVTHLIGLLQEQGDIYKAPYVGQYCVPCETFVAVGPETKKDDKGNYICPSCGRPLAEISEDCYYFRLSAYTDQLLKFYEDNPDFIVPRQRMNEVVSFVKEGLKDLCISRRTVTWGIPFPGDPEHTVYVWADALVNYISAIGFGIEEERNIFDFWWPADLHVMAKDIVKFHAVYWPALLMAVGLPLPKKLLVHGFILSGHAKMSKSLGNVMDPEFLKERYGVEPVRYYLIRQMPISQDGRFDLKELEERITADLANNLGNLLNRANSLAFKYDLKKVSPSPVWEPQSVALKERCEETIRFFEDEMDDYQYHIALSRVWNFISEVNSYFHSEEPWVKAKENKEYFEEILSAVFHSLFFIAIMLWSVMPSKMEELLNYLGISFVLGKDYETILHRNEWNLVFELKKIREPLFKKPISEDQKDE